jgi:ribosomal-protein-alanine acetyltransferase
MATIRNTFETGEIPSLYEIEKECFTEEFRWTEQGFREEVMIAHAKNNIWIVEQDGRIVGFLLTNENKNRGHIATVNISKEYRRRGLAFKLITSCEGELKKRGFKEIMLEVSVENAPAIILYLAMGYKITGWKRHYYRMYSHALEMSKKL